MTSDNDSWQDDSIDIVSLLQFLWRKKWWISAVTFVTGHRVDAIDWGKVGSAETVVLFMGLVNFAEIARVAVERGLVPLNLPARKNDVRLLLLMDVGGTMDPYFDPVSQLLTALHEERGLRDFVAQLRAVKTPKK
jgi:hypothetical protein